MKHFSILAIVGLSVLLCSYKTVAPTNWTVDKVHSKIGFSITHNMASDVEGSFKIFDATITTISNDFEGSTINFTADAAGITTDNELRDKHIKSADFLDAEKFPKLTFKSSSVTKRTASTYKIVGNMTLHGITKRIVLDALVRIPPAATGVNGVAGFKISGVIKRSDFAIGKGFANVVLGDDVVINANGEFKKQ